MAKKRSRGGQDVRVLHVPLGSKVFERLEKLKGARSWPEFLSDMADTGEGVPG